MPFRNCTLRRVLVCSWQAIYAKTLLAHDALHKLQEGTISIPESFVGIFGQEIERNTRFLPSTRPTRNNWNQLPSGTFANFNFVFFIGLEGRVQGYLHNRMKNTKFRSFLGGF